MCDKVKFSDKMSSPEIDAMIPRTPEERHNNRKQIFAALAVSLGPLAGGLAKGYMSPAIVSMQMREGGLSEQNASWIASLSLLGALIGGIFGGVAMKAGRRRVLLITALPYTLTWMVTGLSTSVEMIIFSSFVAGVLVSFISMTSQVYVTEIAVSDIRGGLSSFLKILSQIGILISFSAGAYLNHHQLAFVVAGAPILLFVALLFIPETPSALLLKGKREAAEESLRWLRGPGVDIKHDLDTIEINILESKERNSGLISDIFSERLKRPVLITCGLMFFQRFSASYFLNFYAAPMLKKILKSMSPHGVAIANSAAQLLALCLSGMLIDKIGRLPLLMISGVFMSVALAGFGSFAYFEVGAKNATQISNGNTTALLQMETASCDWIPLMCILTFTIAFALGIGPISSLLTTELFPLEYRNVGSSIATSFSHLCGFVNIKTSADIQALIGLHGLFWIYSGIAVLGLLFVIFFVPETKGRDIDEMSPKFVQTLCINDGKFEKKNSTFVDSFRLLNREAVRSPSLF